MGVHHLPNARAAVLAGELLNRHSPREIADAVEILVNVLDMLGGEPDLEEGGDDEPGNGDDKDLAWPEWNQRNPYQRAAGVEMTSTGGGVFGMTEDDEPDDHDEEDDAHGQCDEDGINTGSPVGVGPGCVISDDDFAESGPIPSYGIDQTNMVSNPNYPGIDPAPDMLPDSSTR